MVEFELYSGVGMGEVKGGLAGNNLVGISMHSDMCSEVVARNYLHSGVGMDLSVGGMHLGGLDLDYNFDYSGGMRRDHAADKEVAVLVIHMQACYSSE